MRNRPTSPAEWVTRAPPDPPNGQGRETDTCQETSGGTQSLGRSLSKTGPRPADTTPYVLLHYSK